MMVGLSNLGEASVWTVDEFEELKPSLRAAAALAAAAARADQEGDEAGGRGANEGAGARGKGSGSAVLSTERAAVSHLREKHQEARKVAAAAAAAAQGARKGAAEKRIKGRNRHRLKSPSQKHFGSSF
jgi:hypothetical protein